MSSSSANSASSASSSASRVIQRAYKTELARNNAHITACKQHVGAARWADTWGLARTPAAYCATGRSPSAIDWHRDRNALKQTDVPWMYAVSQCAPQEALRNLATAFAHFFRTLAKLATLADSSSERQNACGAASAGLIRETQVKLAPMKQEPNTSDASA